MFISQLTKDSTLGQVWTPDSIASYMAKLALRFCETPPQTVLDPACGPATFQRAVSSLPKVNARFVAYDIDKRFSQHTKNFLTAIDAEHTVCNKDYLKDWSLGQSADLVIMNPPYVRQEKIPEQDKSVYLESLEKTLHVKLDRRSNLFIYFLAKALVDVRPGGIICAIVYDALENARYGVKALELINRHCECLHKEATVTPFDGVLIDATILILKRRIAPLQAAKSDDATVSKNGFTQIGNLASVQRGVGFLKRSVFEAREQDSHYEYAKVFVSKQRKLDGLFFKKGDVQERAYLFERMSDIPGRLQKELLKRIKELGIEEIGFTYKSLSAPILFNYYIRNHPRHLLNLNNIPASDNFYLVTPRGFANPAAWLLLNTSCYLEKLMASARSQGHGLKKLQLYEYKSTLVPDWRLLPDSQVSRLEKTAIQLIKNNADSTAIKKAADEAFNCLGKWSDVAFKKAS